MDNAQNSGWFITKHNHQDLLKLISGFQSYLCICELQHSMAEFQ